MKKIIFTLFAAVMTLSASAQGIEIQKKTGSTTTTVASYINTTADTYKAILKKTPDVPAGGHDYVEIEMTVNNVKKKYKWATMNVGATTVASSMETSFGNYYQWAGTNHWDSLRVFPTSGWGNGTIKPITAKSNGYISANDPNSSYSPGTGTGRLINNVYDVAYAAWGGTWRTPSADEFKALYTACDGTSTPKSVSGTTINAKGVYWVGPTFGGSVVIDGVTYKVPGLLFVADANDTSKRVFFPAAGDVDGTTLDYAGTRGLYWSSSLVNSSSAYRLYFRSDCVNPQLYYNRYFGYTVRPVSE